MTTGSGVTALPKLVDVLSSSLINSFPNGGMEEQEQRAFEATCRKLRPLRANIAETLRRP